MAIPIRFEASVERIDRCGPDVATFHLLCKERSPRFKPGQFLHFALDPYDPSRHWPESRIFSIASGPGRLPGLRLTIARKGRFTSRILDEVAEGRTVWLKGPYGEFIIAPPPEGGRVVIIAGGTGITPFCAFMEEMLRDHERYDIPVTVYYGARTPDLLLYRDLTDMCRRSLSQFRVRYFLETGCCDSSIPGRLDIDRIVSDQADPKRCFYYLSGPREMIEAFRLPLGRSHGIPEEQVFIDAWE